MDHFLERFANTERPCQVLSLGAGFDTTWFCLKKENRQPMKYIELDFQEVSSYFVHNGI